MVYLFQLKFQAMPHFILDCPEGILQQKEPQEVMLAVSATAEATQIFNPKDIKVRMRPYQHYIIANQVSDFIHVFAYIRAGRTDEQKGLLSRKVVATLKGLFPDVPVISMNILDFDQASYVNKSMV